MRQLAGSAVHVVPLADAAWDAHMQAVQDGQEGAALLAAAAVAAAAAAGQVAAGQVAVRLHQEPAAAEDESPWAAQISCRHAWRRRWA